MVQLRSLLGRGYFPKELPSCFKTASFARACVGAGAALPHEFRDAKAVAHMGRHSFPRTYAGRRILGLPNPTLMFQIAEEISNSWPAITAAFAASQISVSTPTLPASSTDRALVYALGDRPLAELRVERRTGARFLVRADIQGFYPSIYTHTIPWAFHTKAVAKRDRKDLTLVGNRLDRIAQRWNDGQTMGLPIGPDASFVLAEVLAAAIDKELQPRIDVARSFRFLDDYEIATSTLQEAEDAMVALGRAAAAFELHLNPTKTRIEPLPQPLGSDWVEIVRSFSLGSGASQRGRMIEFFDAVVGLRRDHPDQLVVEYAMGKLAELRRIERTSWPVVQSILLQLIAVDPSSIRHGLRILQRGVRARWRLDQDETERVLNRIVVEGVRRSHDYEVTWALWGLLVFRLEVSDDAARCLGTSEDSCTALLALAARDQGLLGTPAALCTTVWESQLTQAGLSGPMWLLAYEATVQGFLVPPAGDHLAARPAFRFLRQKRVRFLDRVTRSSRIRRLRRRSPADVVS